MLDRDKLYLTLIALYGMLNKEIPFYAVLGKIYYLLSPLINIVKIGGGVILWLEIMITKIF